MAFQSRRATRYSTENCTGRPHGAQSLSDGFGCRNDNRPLNITTIRTARTTIKHSTTMMTSNDCSPLAELVFETVSHQVSYFGDGNAEKVTIETVGIIAKGRSGSHQLV
jgi:hypothetical protein